MEIHFQNPHQATIADLLWNAQTTAEVKMIVKTFGHEGQVVHQMMIAAAMDEITDTDIAEQVLSKFRS